VSAVIPSVPFSSLSFGNSLGHGRNGCVFRADWHGKSVAVKQFDLGRTAGKQRFRNEISAYARLKHAQGVLVPKALFLTQSKFGIAYLGLELGRMPEVGDDVSNWGQIIQRLRTEYGFCHGDADGRNGVFIKDNNQGDERLVAIDLEEYSLVDTSL
jgi:tRNA A-37 threonylcarbamoyl transferase component Bud32